MKKGRITKQLFISTFIVMSVMIGAILFVQNLFFDKFYKQWKIENLNNNMTQISRDFEENDWSYTDFITAKQNFFENNNAQIDILNKKGESIEESLWIEQPWYNITCTINKEEYYFQISEFDIISQLGKNNLEIGESYILYGSIKQNNNIEPFLIYSDKNDSSLTISPREKSGIDFFNDIISVTEIQQATRNEIESQIYPFSFKSLPSVSNVLGSSFIDKGSVIIDSSSSAENIFITEQISRKDGESYNVTVSASIQPIDEASGAFALFYPYFFIFVLAAALILALLYSKKVARPLLKINQVANQMAKLDFDKRLDTKANNEFGSLSESLNTLAANLDRSLSELKQANLKLTEDIKEKEKQEKAQKDFVANVSHELKTPLGVMRCYVDSLQDNVSPNKTKEYYDVLKSEINKMNGMILQMLELTKAQSGDITLNVTKFNIKDMLDDVLVLYSFQAQERELTFYIQGDFADILADSQKIEQVCTNLISNAVSHSLPSSEVKITGQIKDGKNRISVINKCKPIKQHDAQKLWERFYKADSSHKGNGTGLGLSIVAAILDIHNAEYGVIAHENSIEFYFDIKLA